jgi:hypothetical protein
MVTACLDFTCHENSLLRFPSPPPPPVNSWLGLSRNHSRLSALAFFVSVHAAFESARYHKRRAEWAPGRVICLVQVPITFMIAISLACGGYVRFHRQPVSAGMFFCRPPICCSPLSRPSGRSSPDSPLSASSSFTPFIPLSLDLFFSHEFTNCKQSFSCASRDLPWYRHLFWYPCGLSSGGLQT